MVRFILWSYTLPCILLMVALFIALVCPKEQDSFIVSAENIAFNTNSNVPFDTISKTGEQLLLIIGTVDGNVHAIDENMNRIWTSSTGGPLASGSFSSSTPEKQEFVIPSLDGNLLVHNGQGMRKTSVTARVMTENSPFISPDGVAYIGKKDTRVFGLDLSDGSLISDLASQESKIKLQTSESTNNKASKLKTLLWLGRIDYSLKALDGLSGEEKFNISYSEMHPLVQNFRATSKPVKAIESNEYTKSPFSKLRNQRKLQKSLTKYEQSSIISTPEGLVYLTNEHGELFQDTPINLESPIVNAYMVQVSDGEPVNANKVYVHYSLNDIRYFNKLQNPSKPVLRDKKVDYSSKELTPELSFDDKIVIVQGHGKDANGMLYAMELLNPIHDIQDGIENAIESSMLALPSPIISEEEKAEETIDGTAYSPLGMQFAKDLEKSIALRGPQSYIHQNLLKHKERLIARPTIVPEPIKLLDKELSAVISSSEGSDEEDLNDVKDLTSKGIRQIRGLHRLIDGNNNDEFWLPKFGIRQELERLDTKPDIDISSEKDVSQAKKSRSAETLTIYFMWIVYLVTTIILLCFGAIVVFAVLSARSNKQSSKQAIFASIDILFHNIVLILNAFGISSKFQRPIEDQAPLTRQREPEVTVVEVDENGRQSIKVGALVVSDQVLGYGSHGTVVFSGTLNGRPVAVKRMLSQLHRAAEREISLLIRSDGHPNVVRYFIKEQRSDFIYLGLQLCKMSLKEFITVLRAKKDSQSVENSEENKASAGLDEIADEVRRGMHQIAEGLSFLHSQRIVHRDIKPHNILCADPGNESRFSSSDNSVDDTEQEREIASLSQLGEFVLKISDMGLSKQLDRDEHSFSTFSMSLKGDGRSMEKARASSDAVSAAGPVGTIGWQAPELITGRYKEDKEDIPLETEVVVSGSEATALAGEEALDSTDEALSPEAQKKRRTLNVDVFSMGCVFYYILTLGEHPFGKWYEREANIATGKLSLSGIASIPDAQDLIELMLRQEPIDRPTSAQVCGHPFFWSSSKRLEFLTEFSDRLEKEAADSQIVLSLETGAQLVLRTRWDRTLDHQLLEDMGKYRKYDSHSVRDLLRVIRNKRHHFHELPQELKDKIGPIPTGFTAYFERRFPRLLLHCVAVANKFLQGETVLAPWLNKLHNRQSRQPVVSVAANLAAAATESDESLGGQSQSEKVCSGAADVAILTAKNEDSGPVAYSSDKLSGEPDLSSFASSVVAEEANVALEDNLSQVVVWEGSQLQHSLGCKGWWRDSLDWSIVSSSLARATSNGSGKKQRPMHLTKAAADFKYRTRLCSHWESTDGAACPMRKRGKCIFAHGPLELRVKETRRDRWTKGVVAAGISANLATTTSNPNSSSEFLRFSGGEDVLGAARSIERVRNTEGSAGEYDRSSFAFSAPNSVAPFPTLPPAPPLYHPNGAQFSRLSAYSAAFTPSSHEMYYSQNQYFESPVENRDFGEAPSGSHEK